MRQIFPVAEHARQLGPADPLSAAGPLRPAAPSPLGTPGSVGDLVSALGAIYAYPAGRWIRANMIASVDGAISVDGRSGGLSGDADRLVFAVLRSLADVIVVGAGTARTERYGQAQPGNLWPELRAGRPPAPPVAVVTRRLGLDLGSRLFRPEPGRPSAGLARTIVLTTELAPADRIAAAQQVADVVVAGADSVSATAAVDALAARGHIKMLVEGGPMLLGELAADSLIDELCLTISPVLEGGRAAGRVTACGRLAVVTGLRLAMVLEDDGFLLTRYVRARRR